MDEPGQAEKFFKSLFYGANFKWMELVQSGASQERIDAQSDLALLLRAIADKAAAIEAMELEQERGIGLTSD